MQPDEWNNLQCEYGLGDTATNMDIIYMLQQLGHLS